MLEEILPNLSLTIGTRTARRRNWLTWLWISSACKIKERCSYNKVGPFFKQSELKSKTGSVLPAFRWSAASFTLDAVTFLTWTKLASLKLSSMLWTCHYSYHVMQDVRRCYLVHLLPEMQINLNLKTSIVYFFSWYERFNFLWKCWTTLLINI